MPYESARSPRRGLRRDAAPLNCRAIPHTALLGGIALACLVPWLAGCDRGAPKAAPQSAANAVDPADKARIEALREAYAPISPTLTTDKQYAWRQKRREMLEELEHGPPSLGAAALEAFQQSGDALDEWRTALLSIAARTDRELARPLLERLSLVYDGSASLGVRTEALRLWCETAPAHAVKLLEPILLQPRPSATYPPKEQMLRHWISAARAIRQPIDTTLASIATDIAQPGEARYVAVDELGKETASAIGAKALEAVLVESGSDGMLRRKAAQAMRGALPRAQMCAILTRVSENESDIAFLNFLADMLDKNCR